MRPVALAIAMAAGVAVARTSRGKAAINCLRGRPTIYRAKIDQPPPPPALTLAKGNDGMLISESYFKGWRPTWSRT